MKKIIYAFALLGIVACQQEKIAFVDNVTLMDEYQEKIDIEAKYKSKAETITKRRDSISQAFQIEAQAFQIKAQKMAPKKAQEEYALLQQRGQFIGQQLQQEEQLLQIASQKQMDSIITKVKDEIKAYGKANNYTYILGGGVGGSVIYGAEANDVTAPILKLLNDKYKK